MNNHDLFKDDLEALVQNCSDNYGLHNGKAGLCMYYFALFNASGNQVHLQKARLLLDDVCNNIEHVTSLNFSNGMAGIGWAIEWLVQYKFEEANTNEILEEVDDAIYKTTAYCVSPGLSLANGTLGKALYMYKRVITKNARKNRYRYICNIECLVMLIDEIFQALSDETSDGRSLDNKSICYEITPEKVLEIGQAFMFLEKCVPLKVNAETTNTLLLTISRFIDNFGKCVERNTLIEMRTSYLYLIYAYYCVGVKMKEDFWTKNATALYSNFIKQLAGPVAEDPFGHYVYQSFSELTTNEKRIIFPYAKQAPKWSEVFTIFSLTSRLNDCKAIPWQEGWLLQ